MSKRKVFGIFSWEAIGAIAGVAGVAIAAWQLWGVSSGTVALPVSGPSVSQVAATSQSGAHSAANSVSSEPASHLFKDIVLVQHAGVDIDGTSPVITQGLSGITGDNDVYHYSTEVSSNALYTPSGLYEYTGNPANAYKACTTYLADTTHTLDPDSGFDIGRAFCFRTSDGRLAFLQMTALDGSPGIYNSVTFNVRVWDK